MLQKVDPCKLNAHKNIQKQKNVGRWTMDEGLSQKRWTQSTVPYTRNIPGLLFCRYNHHQTFEQGNQERRHRQK